MGTAKAQDVQVVFDKFDKSKNKDSYKLLDIKTADRFRIVTFQVDMPEEERKSFEERIR